MKFRGRFIRWQYGVVLFVAAAGCAASQDSGPLLEQTARASEGGAGGATSTVAPVGGSSPTSTSGGTGFTTTSGSTTVAAPPILYVHSGTTLYRADPSIATLQLSAVGDFDCVADGDVASMTDIAVNEAGAVWGVSASAVHRLEIEGSSVHCAENIPFNNPDDIRFYGLTFAPTGILDDAKEVLVAGNSAGELWVIRENGAIEQRGNLGTVPMNDGNGHSFQYSGKRWELSGDIVFAANNGSPVGFATVRDCPNPPDKSGCNPIDTLIELNVGAMTTATSGSVLKAVRGQIVQRAGCEDGVEVGYGSIYGIALFEDRVFGFSTLPNKGGGYAIDISNADGTGCLMQVFPDEFWAGAGISTLVPIEAPPPK